MRTRQRSWCGIAIMTILGCGNAARADESLQPAIDSLAQPYVDADVVVGMMIAVVRRDDLYLAGYGKIGAKDDSSPRADTIYEIGSVSKTFTGTLLGEAVARKQVRLDQPVDELLPPGVTIAGSANHPILLRHLATHTSGLPRLPDNLAPKDPANPYADFGVEQLHHFLQTYRPTRTAGARIEYSNLGAGLLGYVLALREKCTYEDLLRRWICEPLQMPDTVVTLSPEQHARMAPPHFADGSPAAPWDIPVLAGAGGIRSTAQDMVRYVRAVLKPPEGPLGEGIELAWQVQQPPIDSADFPLGLGWHLARDGTTRWHNGETGGYHSMVLVNRDVNAAVVVLANSATGEVDTLGEDLMRLAAGGQVEPRTFDRPIHVAPEVMQRFVGRYQLAPEFIFTVSLEGDRLMVGVTGQPTFRVFPRSETEWFYKVVDATLTFTLDDQGQCQELDLFQGGIHQTARRLD